MNQIKILVLFVLVINFFSSCKQKNDPNEKEIKTIPVFTVVKKDTIVTNKFVADIQAKNNVEIHSRIAGLIERVYVNEGQMVKKGQLLFKLSDAELRIELLKAQATLKNTQADLRMASVELRQLQTLFDKNVIAENELELAKAKYEAAEAKVAYANAEKNAIVQQIGFTSITAPFNGVIDKIPFKEGSLVQNGLLLTTISELDEVFAYFSLPENRYFQMLEDNNLGTHRSIELILPNGTKYNHVGVMETAEGEIDRETGSIQFKVKFPNPEGLIKHGTSGKLIISENKHAAIIIAQKSVFSIQDKRYVFVVDKNNIVRMKSIIIGKTLDDVYIIDEGLNEGDIIVKEGTQSLRDGEEISPKK